MNARYEFIDEEKATTTETGGRKYTVVKMCEWMEVSTSGFYDWLTRPQSATAVRRDYLKLLIEKAFTDSDGTYGYRRLHAQLARWNEHCTPELVRALMRALGLVACQPRPWRHSLTESGPSGPIPDLVARDSPPTRRERRWSAILPTFPPGRAGCIWLPSLTVTPKAWWGGRWMTTTRPR